MNNGGHYTHICSTVQRKYTTGEERPWLSDAGKGERYLLATESPWRDGRGFALAPLLDHGQHFVVVRPKVHMVGKEVVPEIVPASSYIIPKTTPRHPIRKRKPLDKSRTYQGVSA